MQVSQASQNMLQTVQEKNETRRAMTSETMTGTTSEQPSPAAPMLARKGAPRRFRLRSRPQGTPQRAEALQHVPNLVGLGPMTPVCTALGSFPAHTLREGDRLLVKGGGYRRIRKIDRVSFDEEFLEIYPGARPVVIRAGAFGLKMPAGDVMLAPCQQLDPSQPFVRDGHDRAMDALSRAHVYRGSDPLITYTVLSLGQPAMICCSGIWVRIEG